VIQGSLQAIAEWERQGTDGLLSLVIPAHNEEGHIAETVTAFHRALADAGISHEILVINDNSTDRTAAVLAGLAGRVPVLRVIENQPPNGFGFAVRCGLANFRGDSVAIVMADMSDVPADLIAFHAKLREGYDCVFGSRFVRGGRAIDYPWLKLMLNRAANLFVRALFRHGYNDTTNAFKLYRRRVIAGVQPLLSHHFNLTVELPLKAMVRGYSFAVLPNTWINRKEGASKFRIQEMGSRYLFIVLYCLIERLLSRGDYHRVTRQRQVADRTDKA
jgi:dolichol-phosphate mannosyltransferase